MIVAELLTKLGFQVDPKGLDQGINRAKSTMSEFKSFLGKLTLGYSFVQIGKTVLNAAREMESLNAELKITTGSADKAKNLFKDMKDYAVMSSYYMKDVAKGGQLLLNQGVEYSRVMPLLKMFGDVAGASADRMKSLAFAYGHVANYGYMTGRERNMFVLSGMFNPVREQAKMMAEARGLMKKGDEVKEGSDVEKFINEQMAIMTKMISKRQFTRAMVDEAFVHATTAGGMFFQNQMLQAQTFTGKLSTMLDNLLLNTAAATQKLFPIFNRIFTFIGGIPLEWLGEVFDKISSGLIYMGAVITAMGVPEAFEVLKESVVELLVAMGLAVGGTAGAGDAMQTLGIVLGFLISRFIVGITVLVKIITWFMQLAKWLRENRELAILLGIALASVFGPMLITKLMATASAMRILSAVTMGWGRALQLVKYIMASWEISKIGTMKVLFMDLTANIQRAAIAIKGLAMTTVGVAGLAIAAIASWAWAGWELYKVNKENNELQDRQETAEAGAGILQRRMETMALAKKYREAGDTATADKLYARADGQLAAYHKLNDDLRRRQSENDGMPPQFADFDAQMKAELEKTNKLLEDQKEQAKKDSDALNKKMADVNITLKNEGNSGRTGLNADDVLNLADKAVRAAFTTHLQRSLAEAE